MVGRLYVQHTFCIPALFSVHPGCGIAWVVVGVGGAGVVVSSVVGGRVGTVAACSVGPVCVASLKSSSMMAGKE